MVLEEALEIVVEESVDEEGVEETLVLDKLEVLVVEELEA